MKKRFWLILVFLLSLGVFSNEAIASDKIFSKEYEIEIDVEGNTYSIGDFSIDNEKLYILDKNKEEIEIVFKDGKTQRVKLNEDEKFSGSSMISVDSGVIYVLNISLKEIKQIVPGEIDKIYPIELDTEAISEFKVIYGQPHITLSGDNGEETRIFENKEDKYILDKTLPGRYIGDYSYKFTRNSENLQENFGGTFTITNREKDYTYHIKINSRRPLFGSKIIGYTDEGNFIIVNNESDNIKRIQLINQSGDVLIEQETFNSLDIFKTGEYEEGNVYFINNREGKVTLYKNKWADPSIQFNIFINGKPAMDSEAFIRSGRIFVPLRYISEKLDFDVEYDEDTKNIKIKKDDKTVDMNVDVSNYKVNDEKKQMDTSPILKDGTTFVPIRFISESLGEKVLWDGKNFTALIGSFKFNGDRNNKTKVEYPEVEISMYVSEEFDKFILTEFSSDPDRYVFIDKKNNMEYVGGHLGSIQKETSPSPNIVPGYILKYEDGIYTTITFPSDVQFNVEDKEYEEVYLNSAKILKEAIETIEFK